MVSAMAVVIIDVPTDIGVDVLVDANVNVFAGVMAVFAFVTPVPFEEFRF